MKRILCLLLAVFLLTPLLSACGPDDTTIRVGVLSGPTAMGALKLMKEGDERYEFEIYTSPDLIVGDIIAGNLDIAALPTNNAAMLYNQGADIRVIALNTLGVLHLLDATGTVTELSDLEGKTVYVPNAGSNPEYVLRHVLAMNGINATVETSVVQPPMIQQGLLDGTIGIAVLPQPAATAIVVKATSQGKTVTAPLDLSVEWNKDEATPVVQGCLVASADFCKDHPRAIAEFLEKYEASVDYMTDEANLEAAAALVVEYGILPAAAVAKKALPKCAITYVDGPEMKVALDAFYDILHGYAPASIGGSVPGADFYYNAK